MAANNYPPLTREDIRQELQNELRHYATKEDVHRELRHYATKEDIANLRAEMSQMETRLIKWMVGSVLAGAGIAATIALVIQRLVG